MHKKLIMTCMAIAFAAFVVAPAASASPVLTEGGSALGTGVSIKGTTTGVVKFTMSTGTVIECTHAEFKGSLTKNSGTRIAWEVPLGGFSFSGTAEGGKCTSGLGAVKPTVTNPLCFETAANDTVVITGCSGSNVTFTFHVGAIECPYSATSLTGTFNTNADATVNIVEQPFTRSNSNIFCPASGKLDADFDLYTTDGTTLFVS